MNIEMTKREKLALKIEVQRILHPEMVQDVTVVTSALITGQISARVLEGFYQKHSMLRLAKTQRFFSSPFYTISMVSIGIVGIVLREQKRRKITILVKRMEEMKKDII